MPAAKPASFTRTVECVTDHVSKGFGEVPAGSVWAPDSPVVAANRKAFREVDWDQPTDGDAVDVKG